MGHALKMKHTTPDISQREELLDSIREALGQDEITRAAFFNAVNGFTDVLELDVKEAADLLHANVELTTHWKERTLAPMPIMRRKFVELISSRLEQMSEPDYSAG